jgi:hypothetical protein
MPRGRLLHFALFSLGRWTACLSVILAQTLACSHSGFPDSPTGQRGTIDPSKGLKELRRRLLPYRGSY